MVYDLIFNELMVLFNAVIDTWQYTGVEILAFSLTIFFVGIFLLIPLYAFKISFDLISGYSKRKRWK